MLKYLNRNYDFSDPSFVSQIDDVPFWSAPFGYTLLEHVDLRHNVKALDIGTGLGFPLLELVQRLGHTSQVVGIDPWTTALHRIKNKKETMDIRNAHIVNCVAESMPFNDEYFDLIVSNNGINNVTSPEIVFQECHRVCRPGAQMVLTVNLPETMKEFYSVFKQVLAELGKNNEINMLSEHIFHKRMPLEPLTDLIEKTGFSIEKVSGATFYWRYVDGTAMLNHSIINWGFLNSWKEILRPKDRETVFGLLENRLNEIAQEERELKLTIPYVCINIRK